MHCAVDDSTITGFVINFKKSVLVRVCNKLGGHDSKLTIGQNFGYREVSEPRADYGLGSIGTCLGLPPQGVPYLTKKKIPMI